RVTRIFRDVSRRCDLLPSLSRKPTPAARLASMAMNTTAIRSLISMMGFRSGSKSSPDTGRQVPGRRLVLWCVLCVSLAVLGVYLGIWQWGRAADKQAYLEALAEAPRIEAPKAEPVDG